MKGSERTEGGRHFFLFQRCIRYTVNGSNKRDPLFDLRASLLTMLVNILRLVSEGDGDEEARERRRGL